MSLVWIGREGEPDFGSQFRRMTICPGINGPCIITSGVSVLQYHPSRTGWPSAMLLKTGNPPGFETRTWKKPQRVRQPAMMRTDAAVVRPSLASSGSAMNTPQVPTMVRPRMSFGPFAWMSAAPGICEQM